MNNIINHLNSLFIAFAFLSCVPESENKNDISTLINNENLLVVSGNRNEELIFNFEKLNKKKVERIWADIELSSKLKIGGIEKKMLMTPTLLRVDNNNNIYILDNVESSVKKFSSSGQYIRKFGGVGKGEGEFTKAFYMDISGDGIVGIINHNDHKFAVYDGNNVFEYKLKLSSGRLSFVSTDEVVLFQFMDPINTSPFQKINFVEGKSSSYQNFINENSFGGKDFGILPFLIGNIHRYEHKQMIYVSTILGYVILYSETGSILKVFNLIDSNTNIKFRQKEKIKGMNLPLIRFPRFEEDLFLDSHIFSDKLFVLEILGERNAEDYYEGDIKKEYYVDIYSISEGKYLYSIELKNFGGLISVYFTESELYLVKENTEIEVFDYKIIDGN